MLRSNQRKAIDASVSNGFASGVHFHATGTGKSWIALQLAAEFKASLPPSSPCNILWICEQKSILIEQFNKDTLKSRGFGSILSSFLVLDFSQVKPADWVDRVNSAAIWRRPMLIVVNRAFLTSSVKYEGLRIPLHLLIHDECHTITNATTQAFYAWTRTAYPALRCIGFSATPTLQHEPYTRILSQYTIYDACTDGTIVPPTISWLKTEGELDRALIRRVVAGMLESMPYKKCILWCGMIQTCFDLAAEWGADPLFAGWTVAVDTSEGGSDGAAFVGYDKFQRVEEKGLLFCAGKHREGSDIYNLDSCVFLDHVANRNAKTFIQCIGRVLRRDAAGKKTTGAILDICAASSIRICDRINAYLNPTGTTDVSAFPFQYAYHPLTPTVQLHTLKMVPTNAPGDMPAVVSAPLIPLAHRFIRSLPAGAVYSDRLREELHMFESKNLSGYVHQALDILNLADSSRVPHVTRGSCGSSLVCYLLGISHVDPVRWNIRFARFLNEFRTTLPDIDFDFPHVLRDEIFLQIQMRWPGQVARISNHVHYHKKSAMREAVRRVGIRKQLSAFQLADTVRKLPFKKRSFVHEETKRLENTFRTYSLHCGGIVFFADGVPQALKLKTARSATFAQITLNKQDVAKEKQFKIDILSSRALTQLMDARKFAGLTGLPDFDANLEDSGTAALFRCGDNIGITLAETPLMRKAFMDVKPTSVEDIAYCLALIRPAARDTRHGLADEGKKTTKVHKGKAAKVAAPVTNLVYDDDVIDILAGALQCTDAVADQYRRAIAKNDKKVMGELKRLLKARGMESLLPTLKNVRSYGFCKSHAFSYAQLVWQLGYMKVHHPVAFWKAALKHCDSSYAKWVHLYEARLAGAVLDKSKHVSIFAENRRKKAQKRAVTHAEQLRAMGVWQGDKFYEGTYMNVSADKSSANIHGLIAWKRTLSWDTKIKKIAVLVGIAPHTYVEVIASGKKLNVHKSVGVTCTGAELLPNGVWSIEDPTFW